MSVSWLLQANGPKSPISIRFCALFAKPLMPAANVAQHNARYAVAIYLEFLDQRSKAECRRGRIMRGKGFGPVCTRFLSGPIWLRWLGRLARRGSWLDPGATSLWVPAAVRFTLTIAA